MRKVYIEFRGKLIVRADEGVKISEILSEADYDIKDTTGKANIEDFELLDYTIEDSK